MQLRPFLIMALMTIAVLLSFLSPFDGFSQPRPPLPHRLPTYRLALDSNQLRKPWSRNILFKWGTNQAARDKVIEDLKSYLQKSYDTVWKKFAGLYERELAFRVYVCPCDTLLYTLNSDVLIQGTGEVASQPPSSPPGPGGGGDKVRSIDYNYKATDIEAGLNKEYSRNYSAAIPNNPTVDASNILAIMDTGLDPSLFPPAIMRLIWSEGPKTLFNFLPGQSEDPSHGMDDHKERHGSAVTGMALGEIKNGRIYPMLMIMKVLDSNKLGSSFSVSCALSYARQHNAKVINMSLGYYTNGPIDSVLNYYISQCVNASPKPITIFAAAGNALAPHDPGRLCNKPDDRNKLTSERLFYPACLNIAYPNLISVTGLANNLQSSCLYQNYSPVYVTVGLAKKAGTGPGATAGCCKYKFPFKELYYEGTSFATPIVSGMVMNKLVGGPPGTSPLSALRSLIRPANSLKGITKNGSYIPY